MNLKNLIAVIVLYRMSLEESDSFQALLKSIENNDDVLTLLVYNNSPAYWEYRQEKYEGLNILYLSDSLNSGVSKAYNTAFSYAKTLKKDYILLLDQDTLLAPSLFDSFFAFEQKFKTEKAGLFCPQIVNKNELISPAKFFLFSSRLMGSIEPGCHALKGLSVINSGLLISTLLFESVDGYNEHIKLDFSDIDFLKRCLKVTNKIIVLDAKCRHSLSSADKTPLTSALKRFDYYLCGALYYEKTFLTAIGLFTWIILRSVKFDIYYKTLKFTSRAVYIIYQGKK